MSKTPHESLPLKKYSFQVTHYKNKGLYLKYSSFLEFVLFEFTKYEVPSADSSEFANLLLLKYLHPKIKEIHLNFHTLCSGMSQSSSLSSYQSPVVKV